MYFENTGLENTLADITLLDDLMREHGLIRATGWDYERVTWDRRFDVREGTFYLRVFGFTKEGDIGANDAMITLLKPALGKHYFPHGVEYGEGEVFPAHLVKSCQEILKSLEKQIKSFEIHA
ncbi:YugN family protein [Viridibacillus sp. FSL E2-0187]|uniref:YugN family protein n=1 Tax=Viridibacillus TaxID=496496 RepID=UPI00187B61AD|nr:YugN family protein [Viridibacillus sp. JNUCC-6]QOV10704.1 hypothetical protein JNUCC6_19350 [Viridibacillus sp. JNUCC-6]